MERQARAGPASCLGEGVTNVTRGEAFAVHHKWGAVFGVIRISMEMGHDVT